MSRCRRHPVDAGGTGLGAARNRAHRRLLAGGAGPLGAAVPDPSGAPAEGAPARWITTIAAANVWLRETYMAAHNAEFATAPEAEGTAFVADLSGAWREILCIEEGAGGRQRQHARVERPAAAAAGEPPQTALRQGDGARARVPGRDGERLPRPAPPRGHSPVQSCAATTRSTASTPAATRLC
jgi:hypothetical protein